MRLNGTRAQGIYTVIAHRKAVRRVISEMKVLFPNRLSQACENLFMGTIHNVLHQCAMPVLEEIPEKKCPFLHALLIELPKVYYALLENDRYQKLSAVVKAYCDAVHKLDVDILFQPTQAWPTNKRRRL